MADITIKCIDQKKNEMCAGTFLFTEGEQEYFRDRALTPPKRCKSCRDMVKAEREKRLAEQPQE